MKFVVVQGTGGVCRVHAIYKDEEYVGTEHHPGGWSTTVRRAGEPVEVFVGRVVGEFAEQKTARREAIRIESIARILES